MTEKLLIEEESFKIIDACIVVNKKLGNGLEAGDYIKELEMELKNFDIRFCKEKKLDVFYDGLKLNNAFIAPFVCFDKILLQVKTLNELNEVHQRQSINTLKATNLPICLLVNYGEFGLTWQKLVYTGE